MHTHTHTQANGPDKITCWMLHECAEELGISLRIIFENLKKERYQKGGKEQS